LIVDRHQNLTIKISINSTTFTYPHVPEYPSMDDPEAKARKTNQIQISKIIEGISVLILFFFTIRFNSISWTMALFATEFFVSISRFYFKTRESSLNFSSTQQAPQLFKFTHQAWTSTKAGVFFTILQQFCRWVLIVRLTNMGTNINFGVFEAGSIIPTLFALAGVFFFITLAYLSLYKTEFLFRSDNIAKLENGSTATHWLFAMLLFVHFSYRSQVYVMTRNDWRLLYCGIAHLGLGVCVRYHKTLTVNYSVPEYVIRIVEMVLLWYFWGATGHKRLSHLIIP